MTNVRLAPMRPLGLKRRRLSIWSQRPANINSGEHRGQYDQEAVLCKVSANTDTVDMQLGQHIVTKRVGFAVGLAAFARLPSPEAEIARR